MDAEEPVARPNPRPEHEALAAMLAANAELVHAALEAAEPADRETLARAIAATRSLDVIVQDALRMLVGQARGAGASWADIGTLFGVSRQAAFQRFAEPAPLADAPRTRPVRGARRTARTALDAFLAEDYAAMRERFDARMEAACSVELLTSVRDGLGELRDRGAPVVSVRNGYTVVDAPLHFAGGGRRTGRIALDETGAIAGFFVLGPDAP